MKTLVFHGIGSNSFGPLNTCSFSIELEPNKWVLIDCGPDTPRQVKKAGIALLQVKTIVVTHSHLDHCGGIPYLFMGRNLELASAQCKAEEAESRDNTLTLICEQELGLKLIEFFHYCHPEVRLQFDIRILDIRKMSKSDALISGHKLRFVPTDHAVSTYGFRIDDDDGHSLAYSSDTLPCDAFIQLATGVDIVIHEAMFSADSNAGEKTKHSNTSQAGEVIRRIGPKKQAFLMHIQPVQFVNCQQFEAQVSAIAGIAAKYPTEGKRQDF